MTKAFIWRISDRDRVVGERVVRCALVALLATANAASALDKVTFGTNWLADPEVGGFHQALVDGAQAKYGLDVTMKPGGPQSNSGYLAVVALPPRAFANTSDDWPPTVDFLFKRGIYRQTNFLRPVKPIHLRFGITDFVPFNRFERQL